MKKLALVCLVATTAFADTPAPGDRDGEIHQHDNGFLAWDAEGERWLSPDAFWDAFAGRERGRNWGRGEQFPRFRDVNEHDAFTIETEDGACLMYFFHRRWRRANDVWRWDPAFNQYSGCATVFQHH